MHTCFHDTSLAIAGLTHIRAKPNGFTSLHLSDCQFLETFHFYIQIANRFTADDIAQHLDCVRLAIRFIRCWGIDN